MRSVFGLSTEGTQGKLLSYFLAGVLFVATVLTADPCVDRLNFTVNVGQMYGAGEISKAETGALLQLGVINISDANAHLGERLGAGSFHEAFRINGGEFKGLVFLRAKETLREHIQNDPAFNYTYSQSKALGLIAAGELEAECAGCSNETLRLVVDDEGRVIGSVVEYIDRSKQKEVGKLALAEREKALKAMLPDLMKFWSRDIHSGEYVHPAHGDLHGENMYAEVKADGTVKWLLADMGPIPDWGSSGGLGDFTPVADQSKMYRTVVEGRMPATLMEVYRTQALYEEIPKYPGWTSVLTDGADRVPNLVVTEYQKQGKRPEQYFADLGSDGEREAARLALIKILGDTAAKVPEEFEVAKFILGHIKGEIADDDAAGMSHLGAFANIQGAPGALEVVVFRHPR